VNAGVNTTPPSEYFFCFRCFPILDAISDPRNPDYPHTTPAKGRGFHRRRARTLSDDGRRGFALAVINPESRGSQSSPGIILHN
jgi:hypothetical protein